MKEPKKIEGKNLAAWEFPRHIGASLDFEWEALRAGGEPPGKTSGVDTDPYGNEVRPHKVAREVFHHYPLWWDPKAPCLALNSSPEGTFQCRLLDLEFVQLWPSQYLYLLALPHFKTDLKRPLTPRLEMRLNQRNSLRPQQSSSETQDSY